MSHLYLLVEAITDMLHDQERDFIKACAQGEVLTLREYTGRGAEYLGELPRVISQKALRLITQEYRRALTAIPSPSNLRPGSIGLCDDDCTPSVELGIPCRHTILSKLEGNVPLAKWDVHPRWHLRQSTSTDPYRRILDPKIATALRGRPKNIAQPVPPHLAVAQLSFQSQNRQADERSGASLPDGIQPRRGRDPPRGSKDRPTLARLETEAAVQREIVVSVPSLGEDAAGAGLAGARTSQHLLGWKHRRQSKGKAMCLYRVVGEEAAAEM